MKDSIIILCGGGPAPGMNTVVCSVAKTFLSNGYRVIGLHGGYSGLFNTNPRTEGLDFFKADAYFNRGGSYLEMSRFKPTDEDFEKNFNLDLFKTNNIKLLVTVGGDDTASTANRIAKFLEAKKYPISNTLSHTLDICSRVTLLEHGRIIKDFDHLGTDNRQPVIDEIQHYFEDNQ